MSLEVICDYCRQELKAPGALIFGSIGVDGRRSKKHICVTCWPGVEVRCIPVGHPTNTGLLVFSATSEMVVGPPDQQGYVQEYRTREVI